MENIYTLLSVGVYLVSFWLVNYAVKIGYDKGKLTLTEYRQGTIIGFIPIINTIALLASFVSNVFLKMIYGK